jgi:hypothetical protein
MKSSKPVLEDFFLPEIKSEVFVGVLWPRIPKLLFPYFVKFDVRLKKLVNSC